MDLKLLCVENIILQQPNGTVEIQEGDIVNAYAGSDGIRFEYIDEDNERVYGYPYMYEDVGKYFISAFDEDRYNQIYHKAYNCTMYFNDGSVLSLGDGTIKFS